MPAIVPPFDPPAFLNE